MSDIAERLRSLADLFEAGDAPRHVVLHMRAGADEIERLRAGGCARDQGTTQYCAEAARLAAENERLRARLEVDPSHDYDGIYCRDETIRGLEKQIASLLNTLADTRTENMRLRAALERIDKHCLQMLRVPTKEYGPLALQHIARAALNGEEGRT